MTRDKKRNLEQELLDAISFLQEELKRCYHEMKAGDELAESLYKEIGKLKKKANRYQSEMHNLKIEKNRLRKELLAEKLKDREEAEDGTD